MALPRDAGSRSPLEDHAFAVLAAGLIGAGDLTVACTGQETVLTMVLASDGEAAAMAAAAAVALILRGRAQVLVPAR